MNPADPLSQLRDIHLPEAVGFWPLAPGWWVLAILLLALLGGSIFLLLRSIIRNRYRRDAEKLLSSAWADFRATQNAHHFIQQLTDILRRTAIAAYPQHGIKALHGDAWLAFLDQTGKTTEFTQDPGQQLITLPYQPDITDDLAPLYQIVLQWVKHHKAIPLKQGSSWEAAHA